MNEISMTLLPISEIRVVKEIRFEYEFNSKIYLAKAVYLRALSDSYKIYRQDDKSAKLKSLRPGGDESQFPFDELDQLILKGLESKYKNVVMSSWLLLYDRQLDWIRNIKELMHERITLIVETEFAPLTFYERIFHKNVSIIRLPIDMYMRNHSSRCFFVDDVCNVYLSFEEWKEKYEKIKTLFETTYFRL